MDTFFQHGIPEKKTPNTIVNLKDLKKNIEEIKQQGYAVDNMEYYEDVRCVAAPVKNALGHVVAAVGITATTLTFKEDMIHDVAAKVIRIAKEISKALGAL